MRYALALSVVLMACTSGGTKVDTGLVGTWELMVPNGQGVARWVWEIHADGSYAFHAEGPGDVPAHSGTFTAKSGQYTLQSTTLAWNDNGTYHLSNQNALLATGKLGTATWHRVQQAPSDSAATPEDRSGGLPPADIYAYLSTHAWDASLLPAPLKAPHTATVDLDAQATKDGVIGIVRTEAQGPPSPAEISFQIYRDRAAAEAAYAAIALFDSPTFRIQKGELVTSHGYSFKERGEGACLSRVRDTARFDASVTCYLLVQYPTREAVIIESRERARVAGKSGAPPRAAFDRTGDLLLAGIEYWENNVRAILDSSLKQTFRSLGRARAPSPN